MLVSAYKTLLSLAADIRRGATVATAASKQAGSPGASLADLADHICDRGLATDTDERVESIVRRAVTDLLLRTVGNNQALHYDTPIANLGSKFVPTPLQNTPDIFLGTLIAESVRRDLLNLSPDAKAVIGDASHEIAISWTDKFNDRSRRKGVSFHDMMQTITADYPAYAGGNMSSHKLPVDLVATMRLPQAPKVFSLDLAGLTWRAYGIEDNRDKNFTRNKCNAAKPSNIPSAL